MIKAKGELKVIDTLINTVHLNLSVEEGVNSHGNAQARIIKRPRKGRLREIISKTVPGVALPIFEAFAFGARCFGSR